MYNDANHYSFTNPAALVGTVKVGSDGTIDVVSTSTNAGQYLIADAVMIHPGAIRTIDDSFAGFSGNAYVGDYGDAGYYYPVDRGYTRTAARCRRPGMNGAGAVAQWAFTGLADGTYSVYAAWAHEGSIVDQWADLRALVHRWDGSERHRQSAALPQAI